MKEFINYLQKKDIFYECVLIEYLYSIDDNTFTWIGTPLDFDLPPGQRKFVKLCFKDIFNFNHTFPDFHPNQYIDSGTHYFVKNYAGTIESEESIIKEVGSSIFEIKILLPYLLGSIHFTFQSLDISTKIGKGEKTDRGDIVYFDIKSNQQFDFYHPFVSPPCCQS